MRKLETVTGQLVDVENPDPSTIDIEDIAWGLSRISRFCGQTVTAVPYNIALHSVFVADEVTSLIDVKDIVTCKRLGLLALLHDSCEIFTGDLPSPVKQIPTLRPIIKQIEHNLMLAIYKSLGIIPPTDDEELIIKKADLIAQRIESYQFMPSRGKHWEGLPDVSLERLQQFSAPMDSLTSYKLFMEKFNSLHTKE